MYPSGQLSELAARKTILQARIAVRRWECAVAAVELARPIAAVDRGVAAWHQLLPIVKLLAVPVGVWLARLSQRSTPLEPEAKRNGKVAAALAALPLILQAVKLVQEFRAIRQSRARV